MSSKVSFFTVFGRVTRYALQNMWRNFGLALITVSILVLALISVNALIAVHALTGAAIKAVEKQVDISVFFTPGAKVEQIDAVKEYVGKFSEVQKLDYIDADQALADFRSRHVDNPEITKSLDVLDTNPLGSILIIRTKDTSGYRHILDSLAAQEQYAPFIQKRSFENRAKIVDRVQLVTSRIATFSLVLAALFALIAVLIVFNTVRVAIYTQREEISIKKLVGATNGFVRAPFFIEGFIYVALSVGITAGLIIASARVVDPFLGPLFTDGGFSMRELFFAQWYNSFGFEFVALLMLTWITSIIAMRKYLRT